MKNFIVILLFTCLTATAQQTDTTRSPHSISIEFSMLGFPDTLTLPQFTNYSLAGHALSNRKTINYFYNLSYFFKSKRLCYGLSGMFMYSASELNSLEFSAPVTEKLIIQSTHRKFLAGPVIKYERFHKRMYYAAIADILFSISDKRTVDCFNEVERRFTDYPDSVTGYSENEAKWQIKNSFSFTSGVGYSFAYRVSSSLSLKVSVHEYFSAALGTRRIGTTEIGSGYVVMLNNQYQNYSWSTSENRKEKYADLNFSLPVIKIGGEFFFPITGKARATKTDHSQQTIGR